jgi:hypothetical protein
MANYENPTTRYRTAVSTAGVIDEGLRAHMLRVYNYMVAGLALTGFFALGTFLVTTSTTPTSTSLGIVQFGDRYLTQLGASIYTGAIMWVLFLAPLALVFFLSFRINKMSVAAAQTTFLVYAGLLGISLSSIFIVYDLGSIAQVFFITAATFGAMSLWGYTTKRDLTGVGSFLFMGLIGILIAMVVNLFVQSAALHFVISIIGILIFVGLTAFETQRIKTDFIEYRMEGGLATKTAVMGAVGLYILFINIFQFLLMFLGNRE